VTGPRLDEVETKIKQFGFSLSKTDLFSDKSAFSLNSYDQQFPEGPGRGGVDSASEENASSNPWDDAADKVKAEAHPPLPPPHGPGVPAALDARLRGPRAGGARRASLEQQWRALDTADDHAVLSWRGYGAGRC